MDFVLLGILILPVFVTVIVGVLAWMSYCDFEYGFTATFTLLTVVSLAVTVWDWYTLAYPSLTHLY